MSVGFSLPAEDKALIAGLVVFAVGFFTGNQDLQATGIALAFGGKAVLGSLRVGSTGPGSTA